MQNEQQNTSYQGQPQPPFYGPAPTPDRRNLPYKQPWLAGFLSGIFPGTGQLYVGYYKQGAIFGAVFIAIITALSSNPGNGLEPMFGMSLGFTWIYGIIDASRRAQAVNRALDGLGPDALPEDMALPGSGGSTAGGVALIAIGLLLLLNFKFDVSLEWLEDWWPLALIGLGGWLVWKARQDKS